MRRNYNIVVMDGSNKEVLNNISGVVKMITNERAIDYSKLDEDHPTTIVMEFKARKSEFEDIEDVVTDRYPALCCFNVAL